MCKLETFVYMEINKYCFSIDRVCIGIEKISLEQLLHKPVMSDVMRSMPIG